MSYECIDNATVEVCQINGTLLATVQIGLSATAAHLRELLPGLRLSAIIVNDRCCGAAEPLFTDNRISQRIFVKLCEPFADKDSLRTALETMESHDEAAKRDIIVRYGEVQDWDVVSQI